MIVCTELIGYDPGEYDLEADIAQFERNTGGNVVVARTGYVKDGLPQVRLVGEPAALLTALRESFNLTPDEAAMLLEG